MNISRPEVTIVSSPSGKSFTYMVTADSWTTEYQSTARFDSEADAKKEGKTFSKNFDKEATDIEAGTRTPYRIMPTLVEHHKFKARAKLSSNFGG